MKEMSKEIINIDGKDYTLFLNRKGIIAWERFSKKERKKIEEYQKELQVFNKDFEINDDTNPFELITDELIEKVEETSETTKVLYKHLYWIMLYTEHKLLVSEVDKLYDIACEEYGEDKLIELANQMVEDANKDIMDKVENKKQLKNLEALRPKNK